MTSIRLISTSTVKAANPKNQSPIIDLTPWDLQFLLSDYIQRVSDHFPHLTGRLAAVEHDDNTTSFFFDCNNGGALFAHAVVDDVSTRDIIEPVYVPSFVDSFFPLRGVKNCQGTVEPLVAVQVTKVVDGAFISISINHSVMDGASFFHAFSSCLEIVNGSSSLSKPPVFERCFLNNNTTDDFHTIRIPNSYIKQIANEADDAPSGVKVRVFHFSKEVIAKLKEKSNAEVGINDEISSLQALLCHLRFNLININIISVGKY
ncbi:hypothetical protein ERO13_A05G134800v2 [Gossypium hirsutum]|nr:hypothetical protein ERO13_A05G134800v2 [Gossypium hirsutum]